MPSREELIGLDVVRRRPGMYIGNPDEHGLDTCVFELVAHSVDEFLKGFGSKISITLNVDGSVTVDDMGGYPRRFESAPRQSVGRVYGPGSGRD